MKQVINLSAKVKETGITLKIRAEIQASATELTSNEQKRERDVIENRLFNLARDQGFMAHEIKLGAK